MFLRLSLTLLTLLMCGAALTLEFSFTDGQNWDGPYKLTMEVPSKLKGLPQSYFNEVNSQEHVCLEDVGPPKWIKMLGRTI